MLVVFANVAPVNAFVESNPQVTADDGIIDRSVGE